MSISNITINRTQGGLARPPQDFNGVSGYQYYGTITNEASTSGMFKIFTPQDSLIFTNVTSGMYYQFEEYFRFSAYPLYVSITKAAPSTFSEIQTLKNFSNGEIRQVAVFNDSSNYTSSQITALQTIATTCETEHAPLQILYTANITGALSTLTSLTTLSSPRVTFIIGEDFGKTAKAIRTSRGKFVSSIGTALGCLSSSNPQESIAWVQKYNVVSDRYSDVGFINGETLASVSVSLQNTLNDYGYLFLHKKIGRSGVYFNSDKTSVSNTSDFSTIHLNRVFDLCARNIYEVYLDDLNSPIQLESNGTLSTATLAYLKSKGDQALAVLKQNGNISDYKFDIDPNQNILSTGQLKIQVSILPIATAEFIIFNLGYVLKIA